MKFTIHHIVFLLALILSFCPSYADVHSDSLRRAALQIPEGEQRVDWLLNHSVNYINTPDELPFLEAAIDEARRTQNAKQEARAWRMCARNYYNRSDSLSKILVCLDNLRQIDLQDDEEYSIALSDVESFVCFIRIADLNFQKALDDARLVYDRAERDNDAYAYVTFYEIMGVIYSKSKQFEEAVAAFRKGFEMICDYEKYDSYSVQLLNEQISAALECSDYASAEKALRLLDTYIARSNKRKKFPYTDRCYWLMESFYVQLYARQNRAEEAEQHLKRADNYRYVTDHYAIRCYHYARALYLQLLGRYQQALDAINTLDEQEHTLEIRELHATLLMQAGHYKEAAAMWVDNNQLLHEEFDTEFIQQINDLRTRYDVKQLEFEKQEANLSNTRLRLRVISYSLLALAFIMAVLVYLLIQLRAAKRRAEQVNQVRTRFMQNMSHEMRTPLNSILGFSSVLSAEPLSVDHHEMAGLIYDNAQIMLQLVTNALEATMLETSDSKIECRPELLAPICEEAIANVRDSLHPGVKLIFSSESQPCQIRTARTHLRIVLANILLNATKFTEHGEIELAFHTLRSQVRITVTDTGCGIPRDKQEAVFGKFVKLDHFSQGTGLGLAVCRQIVELLGGRIYIDPTYTEGTRVVIEHPL